jgi:prenyltransferase beta subunit
MYNHGFATLALAEAYGTVHDDRIGPALKKAVDLILLAQKSNGSGAWRYAPESSDADITVSGAQMVALMAARNAGIEVPESVVQSGLEFMAKCQGPDGSFGYTPGSAGTGSPRGAIAVLAYALARHKDSPVYLSGARYIQNPEVWAESGYYHYFLYYLSQALFHSDMDVWTKWNERNTDYLVRQQNTDGSWSADNGEIFGTSMALLSLALNYRFLPIYER